MSTSWMFRAVVGGSTEPCLPVPRSRVRGGWVQSERSGTSGDGFTSDRGPERTADGAVSVFPSISPGEGSDWPGRGRKRRGSKCVSKPTHQSPAGPTTPGKGLFHWFDQRTGIDAVLREALDEPIP